MMNSYALAYDKAVKNGWTPEKYGFRPEDCIEFREFPVFIFTHEFAKALFGEELIEDNINGYNPRIGINGQTCLIPTWKWRIYELAVEEDREFYLEQFLLGQ